VAGSYHAASAGPGEMLRGRQDSSERTMMLPTGDLAALGTAMCWATCSMLFTAGGRRVGSLAVNVIRLAIGLAMLTVYGLLVHGQLVPTEATAHAWLWLSISGVVGMAICDLCLFEAFLWVGPRIGMLMLTLSPPVAALLSWVFLGETLTWLGLLGMAMVLAGVAWVVLERRTDADGQVRQHPVAGVLLALVAAIGQGVGMVLSKHGIWRVIDGQKVQQCGEFGAAQIREISGLAVMVAFYFVIRAWPKVAKALTDRRALAAITGGAFFGPFLGVALSMVALRSSVGIASTLIMTAPVFVIPLVVIFHRERVSLRAVAGAIVAVAGVAVLMIRPGHPIHDWLMAS